MSVGSPSSSPALEAKLANHEPHGPASQDLSPAAVPPPAAVPVPSETPSSNPSPPMMLPPPPPAPSFTPSFRPLGAPAFPQYSTFPNPGIQNPSYRSAVAQNPVIQASGGVTPPSIMPPGAAPPPGAPHLRHGVMYPALSGQIQMPYTPIMNGYMGAHAPPIPGLIPSPGIPHYPAPYPMIRPGYPPRPALITSLTRPAIHGVPPIVTPVVRPAMAPPEKPQTTVYVGKISPSVDNDFLLSLLQLCGPVKSWKRAQDPSNGLPKGFGFCEFESAEGVLRALRLLSKLNIDGQELVLNINQATREYLEHYVENKSEREKPKVVEPASSDKEVENTNVVEEQKPQNPALAEAKNDDGSGDKENQDSSQTFGIVTDEDRSADKEAMVKLTSMIDERAKNQPPPPLAPEIDEGATKSNSETNCKLKNGDSDADIIKTDAAEDKNEDETTSEIKPVAESDKLDASSPDRGGRHDRSRERDRERDLRREKDWVERYEREHERERLRRERDRNLRMRESERMYKERVKDWEARERDKEIQRKREKDREKDRDWERRKEISRQETESDDEDIRRRRRRTSMYEERRRKRQREKEDDVADMLKEEEEDIAEAKRREIELQENIEECKSLPLQMSNGVDKAAVQEEGIVAIIVEDVVAKAEESYSANGESIFQNANSYDQMLPRMGSDAKQNSPGPVKKLGFGLVGSGKRTTVRSVFVEDDDENLEDKKMRPLVPIDYSADELHVVQTAASLAPSNIAAAAEFAKQISSGNPKEEKSDVERERSRRTNRSGLRDRERFDDESRRFRDKFHERDNEQDDNPRAENKKLFDAKQLIDMIPKTKEELFSYKINWDVYEKHKLHERMRPWISKKIAEFLGEEEDTLVDFIVKSTREHVPASRMLELLQTILDDEAEMFVLKMWRMLIFEIKKVETGLTAKSRV